MYFVRTIQFGSLIMNNIMLLTPSIGQSSPRSWAAHAVVYSDWTWVALKASMNSRFPAPLWIDGGMVSECAAITELSTARNRHNPDIFDDIVRWQEIRVTENRRAS